MNVGATLLTKNPAGCQHFPGSFILAAEGTGGTRWQKQLRPAA
jgi:hypothetical protein